MDKGIILIKTNLSSCDICRSFFDIEYDTIGIFIGKNNILLIDIFSTYIPKYNQYLPFEKLLIPEMIYMDAFELVCDTNLYLEKLKEIFIGTKITYKDLANRIIDKKEFPSISFVNYFLSFFDKNLKNIDSYYRYTGYNVYKKTDNIFFLCLLDELLNYINIEVKTEKKDKQKMYKEYLEYLLKNKDIDSSRINELFPNINIEEDTHLIIRANKYKITNMDFPMKKIDSIINNIIKCIDDDSPIIIDINELIENLNYIGLNNKIFKTKFRKLCIIDSNNVSNKERIKLDSYVIIPDTKFNLELFDPETLKIIYEQTNNQELKNSIISLL